MADTKISALPNASALGGAEQLAGVQSAANVNVTPAQIKTFCSSSPTLVTPALGVATATSINKITITAPATGSTLTIADGKTLTANRTITFTGTDGVTVTLPATSATMARTDAAQSFTGAQTFLSPPIFPDSASDPGFRFSGTNVGLRHNNASDAGSITVYISSADRIGFRAGHGVTLRSGDCLKWNSTDAITLTYDTGFGRKSAGVAEVNNGTAGNCRFLMGGGAAVASAAALPLPTGSVFHVTGTTNITSITSTSMQSGVEITMIFDGILTVTNGGNMKLAGDMITTALDTLTLVYDGTNWYEKCRSVNV